MNTKDVLNRVTFLLISQEVWAERFFMNIFSDGSLLKKYILLP